ncbi:MAG TPA: hypothetical protein VN327_07545 [Pseudonocardiaceae bacterium]|nr:hypothetical protein [Pseudonocardiaceae bacterium]
MLAGSALESFDLASCPVTDLEPLGTLQSLTKVGLQSLPAVSLTPLAILPYLRELFLNNIEEPVDLSPLAQTGHRLQVRLLNTAIVGDYGPLVKIRKFL